MMLLLIFYTDWLVDRRHCEPKWLGQVKLVQERIATAVKGVADNEEISKILGTSRKLCERIIYTRIFRISVLLYVNVTCHKIVI